MPDPSPYAPSEAYLNALRSFGLTDEQCVEELRQARECDFALTLADEVRKAYDEGKAEAQAYSQYIQANAHRMREGWQPVCFDEFMESEFLVENEP